LSLANGMAFVWENGLQLPRDVIQCATRSRRRGRSHRGTRFLHRPRRQDLVQDCTPPPGVSSGNGANFLDRTPPAAEFATGPRDQSTDCPVHGKASKQDDATCPQDAWWKRRKPARPGSLLAAEKTTKRCPFAGPAIAAGPQRGFRRRLNWTVALRESERLNYGPHDPRKDRVEKLRSDAHLFEPQQAR